MIAQVKSRLEKLRSRQKKTTSNFFYAFVFLSQEKREALEALYRYCRVVDDIVDEPGEYADKQRDLAAWRAELDRIYKLVPEPPQFELGQKLAQVIGKFPMRHEDLLAIWQGCAMDLDKDRYASWEELLTYCYHVASAVGLCCIEIFGYETAGARDYAINLGQALQITNILRDVREDRDRGRIYLPLEELAACGISESEFLASETFSDERYQKLFAEVARRAHTHFARARAAIGESERRRLLVAEIMGEIYFQILRAIEDRGFIVGLEPLKLPKQRKIAVALGVWLRNKLPFRTSQSFTN